MSDKKNKKEEFDPENNKEVDNGPIKSESINQYGKKHDRENDDNRSVPVPDKKDK